MTAQSSSVESIFSAALEINSLPERAAYLDRACAGDTALRTRIEALLKADADAGSFLGKPPAGLDATVDGTADGTDGNDTGAWARELSFLAPCDKPGRLGVLRGKAGEYDVVELVGRGGMGAVLRGVDSKLNRVVAVKVMAPELAENPTAVKRFLREAQAAAAIHHDHVVTIYAVDDEHRPPFLVMEFIEGETLGQKIEREGALRLVQVLRIGSQIAAGLAAAHKHGLIHRDVKPGNILLENGVERVKITDFGLARAADDLEMTQSGLIAGTPQYMSPEQAKGEAIDARSDLFSLGSVLYAMCTGRPAFRAETTMGVLRRVCDDTPRPITQVNPEFPSWLEGIVGKLLAKDPADRFQTAKEVADLLGQHLGQVQNPGQSRSPTTVKLPPRRRSPLRSYVFLAAVGVLLLLCATALVNRQFLFLYFNNFGVITVDKSAHVSRVLVKDEIENRSFLLGQGQTTEIRAHSYIVRVQTEGDVHTFDWQFRDPSSAGSSPLKVNTNYRIHVRPGQTVHLRFSRTSVLPQPRPPAVSSGGAGAQAKTFPPEASAN